MTVPFSIEEAGKLYKKNIRIPTELWQLWKLREEYLADETGVGGKDTSESNSAEVGLARQLDAMSLEDSFMSIDQRRKSTVAEEPKQDPLSLLYQMEGNLKQQKKDMLKASKTALPEDPQAHKKEIKALTQKIADVKKLQRVELIYVSLQSSCERK